MNEIEKKLDEIIRLLRMQTHLREATMRAPDVEDKTYAYFAATCDLLGITDNEVYEDYLDAKKENGDDLPPVSIRKLTKAIKDAQPGFVLRNTTWEGEQVRVWRRK